MATQQEYYDQLYNQGKSTVEQQVADRKKRTEENIGLYRSTIDQHAQAGIAGYQQSMEQAPLDALEQKEDNALREAINRKIVSENMANMGITDSGLNRTQQTALTLQRGKADTEVDQKTKEYVNQLQTAIDGVLLEAETKKADYANTQRNADEEYFDQIWANLENSAREGAATMYAADQEAAAKIQVAQIEAQQEQSKNINSYIAKRMADGVSYDLAAMEAAAIYGTGNEEKDAYAINYTSAYQKAINAGYDEAYAQSIAASVASGAGEEAGAVYAAATEAGTLNVNNMVSLYDGLNFWGKVEATPSEYSSGVSENEQAKKWNLDDWGGVIDRMADKATENINATGHTYSNKGIQYATAKAVVTALKPVLTTLDNDYAIQALENKFPVAVVNAVLAETGLEIVEK